MSRPNEVKAATSVHVSHSEVVQRGYGVDDVDMNSDTESEGESERDTEDESDTEDLFNENQDFLEIINDIKSTFNYSMQLRKNSEEKIENMEEYDQDEWKENIKEL